MAVYVDQLAFHGGSKTFRWKTSCHMFADSVEELHEFAARIGLKRSWFQDQIRLPHYDLTPGRRLAAVKAGAVEVEWCQMWEMMKANLERARGRVK